MISKRAEVYAQCLFELCSEKALQDQLEELSLAFQGKERTFFLSPLISQKEKKKILAHSLTKLSPLLKNFLFVLTDKKALALLPQIKEAYQKILNESLDQVEGEVVSKQPLSIEEKKQLEEALKPILKKTPLLRQKQKSLIGGFYIKVGDYIFNDTIQFHLKRFQGG